MFEKPTLIITHSFPLSSDDYRGRFIAEMLPKKSAVPIVVLTPGSDRDETEEQGGVTIHRFCWRHGYLAGRRIYNPLDIAVFLKMLLIFVTRATKIVKLYHISQVFACWAVPGGLAACILRMLTGVPYSVWALGTDIGKFKRVPFVLPLIFKGAEQVYANSDYLRVQIAAMSSKTVEILPTRGCLPPPTTPRQPIEMPDDVLVVAFVGRLEHVKGIDIFLSVVRRVKERRSDVMFVVFGDGSQRSLVEAAEREGIVRWGGQVTPGELAYYARRIDVLCVTSREESMPVVVWEFQDYCPILSFPVGDIVRHLSPEWIVPDETALVEKLCKIGRKGQ